MDEAKNFKEYLEGEIDNLKILYELNWKRP